MPFKTLIRNLRKGSGKKPLPFKKPASYASVSADLKRSRHNSASTGMLFVDHDPAPGQDTWVSADCGSSSNGSDAPAASDCSGGGSCE